MLHRYWFHFEQTLPPNILNVGCGITAYNMEDAKEILHGIVFVTFAPRQIKEVQEDIDIRVLDANHVIPNMGNPVVRGVWFPLGFEAYNQSNS